MPEEERKAIEVCKELIAENSNDLLNCWDSGEEAKQAISTILYLIEKQQKEIEYWKEQAEGYSVLAKQIQEDLRDELEERDRYE